MPKPIYSIGDHEFTFLDGPPERPVPHVEKVDRPGVPGAGVYRTGKRGRVHTLRSEVDLASRAAALAKWDEYQELIGADPVRIVWADQDSSSPRAFTCCVLDVRRSGPILSLATVAGGINVSDGQPGVWLACEWDIFALAQSE